MATDGNARHAGNFGEEQRNGHELGKEAPFESTPVSDFTIPHLTKALRWLNYARVWRVENRPAWAAFEVYAGECIRDDKPLSGNALHAIIKRHDFVNLRTGRTTTLNRTAIPLFVRWLLRENPGLRAELRRSFFDLLFSDGSAGKGEGAASVR